MRLPFSLRWLVGLTFLLLGLALVAGYSILSQNYFIRGMDNVLALHMERAAQYYLASTPLEKNQPPKDFFDYTVYPQWQQLPDTIRLRVNIPPKPSELIKLHKHGKPNRPFVIFLFCYEEAGNTFYVTHQVSPETMSAMAGRNSKENTRNLFLISITTAIALIVIILLLLRQVSRPITRLSHWTRSLEPLTLKNSPPDFVYPELNQLAQLIQGSLSSVQNSLDREHRFLRHTSHELRTPITTIRSNVELLRKLQSSGQESVAQQEQILDRLDRASLTMKYLTETLLWLSRDSIENLPTQTVALDELIQQLTDEMYYLLKDKPVSVKIETEPCQINLPEIAARIVLGNLIRNAFQHTWEGDVYIQQAGSCITFTNPMDQKNNDSDQGFGLGLQLVEQLCQRIRWKYDNICSEQNRIATINLVTEPVSSLK